MSTTLQRAFSLIATAALGASLAACSSGPKGTVVNLYGGASGTGFDKIIADCNKQAAGRYTIVGNLLPSDADGQRDQLVRRLAAHDSGMDLLGMDVTWTAEFAEAGYIRELDEPPDAADFLPGPRATAEYEGLLYALPFNTDAGLLFYNRDLVDCPADWNEIHDDVERVRGRPQPTTAAVWAGQLREYDGLVVNVLETLNALTPGKPDLFQAGLPALQEAVDTLTPQRNPGRVLPDALDFDEGSSVPALRQGKVAMLRNWPVARGALTAPSTENTTAGTNIDVCQLPGEGAVLGGQNLAVSDRSPHPAEAQELVRGLTSCDNERILFDKGGLAPTRSCAYTTSQRPADDFTRAIEKAVQNATPRPQGPCYGRFSGLFSSVVHRSLVTGERLPPGFLADLRRALDCKPPR